MTRKAQSKNTTDHDDIRRWVEERGGHPACVRRSGGKHDLGILRIDFPGYSGEHSLEEIPWEEFFEQFEQQKLAFLYQEVTSSGQRSFFNKLVAREPSERNARSRRSSKSSSEHRRA